MPEPYKDEKDRETEMVFPSCVLGSSNGGPRTLYAKISTGEIKHISLIERKTPGLLCPDCGGSLIVRKGDIRVPHFAHASGDECRTAGETVLHLMAKEIIANGCQLRLPEATIEGLNGTEVLQPETDVIFDAVEVEVWQNGFRPDLIGTVEVKRGDRVLRRRLIIEIFVTHAVDNRKRTMLRERGDSVLEIDLSKVDRDRVIPHDEMTSLLITDAPRRWLYHRHIEKREAEIGSARRAQQKEYEARKAYAIAAAKREEDERYAAKLTPPTGLPQEDRAWVQEDHRRWRLINHDWLLSAPGDDGIFDVPPEAWRILVLSYLSPWREDPINIPFNADVRPLATRAAIKARKHGWVKEPFIKTLTKFALGKKQPWDPVADALEDYLEEALTLQGYTRYGAGGSAAPSDAQRKIKDAWADHQRTVDAALTLYREAKGQSVSLTIAGMPPHTRREAEDLIARASDEHHVRHSIHTYRGITEALTGHGQSANVKLSSDVLEGYGIRLSHKGDHDAGSTARVIETIERRKSAAREDKLNTLVEQEAHSILSVFLSLEQVWPDLRTQTSKIKADSLFDAVAIQARLKRDMLATPQTPSKYDKASVERAGQSIRQFARGIEGILKLSASAADIAVQEHIRTTGLCELHKGFVSLGSEGIYGMLNSDALQSACTAVSRIEDKLHRIKAANSTLPAALCSIPAGEHATLLTLMISGKRVSYRKAAQEIITRRDTPPWVNSFANASPHPK